MNIENSLLGSHGDLLRLRSARAEIIAGNIANANTPEYKAKDFDVAELLPRRQDNYNIKKTNNKHISLNENKKLAIDLMYRIPNQGSLDGNTVEVDNEIRELTENNIRYQYSLKSISSKIKQIKDILRDI